MKHKRVLYSFIAALAVCCLSVTSVLADPDSDVEDIKAKVNKAQDEEETLESQLADLLVKISDLERDLVATGEDVIKSKKELKNAERRERKQYADMKLRIKYLYESGDDSTLEMILNADSMSDMLSRAEYSEKVHKYDRNMLNEYSDSVQKVKDLKSALEKKLEALKAKQEEFEKQKGEFDKAIESKKAEVEDLEEKLEEAIRIAEEARRKREEEERRRREAAEAAQAAARAAAQARQRQQYYGDASAAQIIVQAAWSQIGVPYVWGGNTPYVGLDCSGLTKWCHAQAGIDIPRYSEDQRWGGTVVYDPLPGDICWSPGHVAIYIGNGQMIEAQQPGTTICVSQVRVTDYVRWW